MADAPVRHEVTEEALRAAWRKCRASSWPATFEETMADPLRARLVNTVAAGLARKPHARPPIGTRETPACRVHETSCEDVRASRRCANCILRPPPARAFQPPPDFVDRKRLAAGDRDDD